MSDMYYIVIDFTYIATLPYMYSYEISSPYYISTQQNNILSNMAIIVFTNRQQIIIILVH